MRYRIKAGELRATKDAGRWVLDDRELPVTDREGQIVGFVDEVEIAKLYLRAATRAEQ